MIKLVLPNQKYQNSYLSGLREFYKENILIDKVNYQEVKSNFGEYIFKLRERRKGRGMPDGYVPETEYWLIDNDEYIGTLKIRHRLNNYLLTVGGHVGYYIVSSRRGKGYGGKILALAIPKAKKIGLDKILITCDETNIPSIKIIEAAGGVLENIVPNGVSNPPRRRYWLNLN